MRAIADSVPPPNHQPEPAENLSVELIGLLWANQTYIFLITLNDGSTIWFRYGLRRCG
jgi:hypothetical protein